MGWLRFFLLLVAVVSALLAADLVACEIRRQLGPGLRPLGPRFAVGRRTFRHHVRHRKRYRAARLGLRGVGPADPAGPLSCDCERPPGAESD